MKKIMILGASILQLPAFLEAKKMGIYTIAIDYDKNAIAFQYCDKHYVISTIDTDSVLKIAKKEKIDGIITLASDMPIRTVAAVCENMNLHGIDVKTAIRATNKFCMREALRKKNVPIPKYFKVNSYNEYLNAIKNIGEEFIVKPVDNSGSRGIFLVDDVNNVQMVTNAFDYSKKYSRNGDLLVEEYMHGEEVSVESFTIEGVTEVVQITNKITTGSPYFVEIGHSQPCKYSKEMTELIKNVAIQGISALGINNSPSHTEIKITEEGPKIVEIGARLGGGNITTHLVPLSTGVNMVSNVIKLAIGDEINLVHSKEVGSAIFFFYSNEDGIIRKIEYNKDIFLDDRLVEMSFQKRVGDRVTKLLNGSDRFGFIITTGVNESDALNTCKAFHDSVLIDIEK